MLSIQNETETSRREPRSQKPLIRILALVEADTVHGPAKNLLNFCRASLQIECPGAVTVSLARFERSPECSPVVSNAPNEFVQAASRLGVPIHSVRERFRFDPRVIERLRRVVEEVDPHVVQSHHSKSHFLVLASGIWRTRRWVAFHHGHTDSLLRLRLYQGLDRWSLRTPAQIVAVSHAGARQLIGFGIRPDKIAVIHNAVEVAEFCEATASHRQAKKARLGLPPDCRVVLAIGRFSKEKAFPDLVAAVSQVRNLLPHLRLRLIIVGEGPERQIIEQAVRSSRMEDITTLPGHTREVSPYYEIADVMAIPSLSENSPNVLLEAMAAGVPVVATAVGGIPEIVDDHKHALLSPPRDPRAMAQAIALVLSDPAASREMAQAARNLVAANYSIEQRARALLGIYQKVCSKSGPGLQTGAKRGLR